MTFLHCSPAAMATSVAASACIAVPASAAITLANAGFETGTTAGWNGSGTATKGYAGYTARAGTYVGLVRAGCPGRKLAQAFTATAGDTLSGWSFFKTQDTLPFDDDDDDDGDVEVVRTATDSAAVVFSSSVSQVGDLGGTPWKSLSTTIPSTGAYSLQIRVDNAGDCGTESATGARSARVFHGHRRRWDHERG